MPLERSEHMARVRGRDTRPEVLLRRGLRARGLWYRLRAFVGKSHPDLVFHRKKVAVFVDGCFWHGCPIHYRLPGSRLPFWRAKLRDNVERDQRQTRVLRELGWRVIRLWGHQVHADPDAAADVVSRFLTVDAQPHRYGLRVLEARQLSGELEERRLVSLLDNRVRVVKGLRNSNSYWRSRLDGGVR